MAWGAVVVVNGPFARSERWLVAGMPLADAWGLPDEALHPAVVAAELDQYGPACIQQVAGPVLAVDLSSGGVLRAMNGIVPVFVGQGVPWLASTSAAVVASISADVTPVPCGAYHSPARVSAMSWDALIRNPTKGLTWPALDAEVRASVSRLGHLKRVWLPGVGGLLDDDLDALWLALPPHVVFLPRLTSGRSAADDASRYVRLRTETAPMLWWRARLAGLWLCAPAFERPAHDMAMSATSAIRDRR